MQNSQKMELGDFLSVLMMVLKFQLMENRLQVSGELEGTNRSLVQFMQKKVKNICFMFNTFNKVVHINLQ
mgnify:CR=1 FL=1